MLLNNPTKEKIVWTNHVKDKMRYYRFSENQILRILRRPRRREEGIAPGTMAAMQPAGTKKKPKEIWTMYQTTNRTVNGRKFKKLKIISAWRYPGVTPLGERPVLPEDTLLELGSILKD